MIHRVEGLRQVDGDHDSLVDGVVLVQARLYVVRDFLEGGLRRPSLPEAVLVRRRQGDGLLRMGSKTMLSRILAGGERREMGW